MTVGGARPAVRALALGRFGVQAQERAKAAPLTTHGSGGERRSTYRPPQQAERQADALTYLLRKQSDYAREVEIEIDEHNAEDELAKIPVEPFALASR